MQSQMEKERKQDKERERQERKPDVRTDQIVQLQLDIEASRVLPRAPPGPMDPATGASLSEPVPVVEPAEPAPGGVPTGPGAAAEEPVSAPVSMGDPRLVRLEDTDGIEHFLTFEEDFLSETPRGRFHRGGEMSRGNPCPIHTV